MKINILDKTKKKKFVEEVGYLGVEKINHLLIKTGKEKIRAFSGSLSVNEIMDLWRLFPIEGIGTYLGKQMIDRRTGKKESRLSLDGLHILSSQINKNIIRLNEKQEKEWFLGHNIELNKEQIEGLKEIKGFLAVVSFNGGDFIGTAKLSSSKEFLNSFLPKERRRKE